MPMFRYATLLVLVFVADGAWAQQAPATARCGGAHDFGSADNRGPYGANRSPATIGPTKGTMKSPGNPPVFARMP